MADTWEVDPALIEPSALQILVPSLPILGLLGGLQIWGVQQVHSVQQILVVKKQTLCDTVFNILNAFLFVKLSFKEC